MPLCHFRHYLAFHPFTVITDHKHFVCFRKLPLDHDPMGRQARWGIKLDLYDWHVIHRDGAKHLNADALSRQQESFSLEPDSCSQSGVSAVSVAYADHINSFATSSGVSTFPNTTYEQIFLVTHVYPNHTSNLVQIQ